MVGLPFSGKTTLARELEAEHAALRLTTDEWHIRLFGDDFGDADDPGHERHNSRHGALESLLWDVAAQALVEAFVIPKAELRAWFRAFEPPTPDELTS